MKIKSIDPNHLLVVLSPTETDFFGIRPETQWQNLHTRLTVAKIFAVACDHAAFSARRAKISIRITASREGDTLLLFSASPRKRYRIKNSSDPMVYLFHNPGDLIDAAGHLYRAKADCGRAALFLQKNQYWLIVTPRFSQRIKSSLILREYGTLCDRGKESAAAVQEHGRLLSQDFFASLNAYFAAKMQS